MSRNMLATCRSLSKSWQKFAFVIALMVLLFGNVATFGNAAKLNRQDDEQEHLQQQQMARFIPALGAASANGEPNLVGIIDTAQMQQELLANAQILNAAKIAKAEAKHGESTLDATTATPKPVVDTVMHGQSVADGNIQNEMLNKRTEEADKGAAMTATSTATTTTTLTMTAAGNKQSALPASLAASSLWSSASSSSSADSSDQPSVRTEIASINTEVDSGTAEVATTAPELAIKNQKQPEQAATQSGIQLAEMANENERSKADMPKHPRQQTAAHYEVPETMPNNNEGDVEGKEKEAEDNKPASKLNIVDLYPATSSSEANHDDDEGYERQENVEMTTMKASQQQSLDDTTADGMQELIHESSKARSEQHQVTDGQAHGAKHPMRTADKISDFTGKLLADQDDKITEIEQKFIKLNVPAVATTHSTIEMNTTTTNEEKEAHAEERTNEEVPSITAEEPTDNTITPTSTTATTTQNPKSMIPVKKTGHLFVERRVKKSFGFPMLHHGSSASISDILDMPRIDFANTKFTETKQLPNGTQITGRSATIPQPPVGVQPFTLSATHPEFSTTKFYNSKELYNELLLKKLHAGNTMFTAMGATTKKAVARERATIRPTVAVGSILTLNKLQELARTAKTTTTQTAIVASTTTTTQAPTSEATKAIKRVSLEATSTLQPTRSHTTSRATATSSASTEQPAPATTTLITAESAANAEHASNIPKVSSSSSQSAAEDARQKLRKAQTRAKLLLKAFETTTNNNNKNIQQNDNKTPAHSATTTTASSAAPAMSTVTHDEHHISSDPAAVTSSPAFFTYSSSTGTPNVHLPPQQEQPAHSMLRIANTLKPIARPRILSRLQEKINSLECELLNVPEDSHLWRGNETHELMLPIMTKSHCDSKEHCPMEGISWEGEAEIQSGDILMVEINDSLLNLYDKQNASIAHTTQVYQVTRPGHEHCDVTEGILLDITPLVVDGRKLVTLYDKDLTEGVNLLIVVSELWGKQCVRLKVTTKTDNCGENADCSGKGVCYSNQAMEEYECQCCSGFAGPHCEEIDACTPSPCTNNGICVDLSQGHEGNSYQCLCPYGYVGKNCQYEADPCNNADCMNGGTCVGNSTHFRCDCTSAYTGPLCQHSLNECESSPCVHGICVDQEDGFRCFCQPGFAGELCNFEYNECESNPCQNAGECIDHIGSFECRCTKGYTGNRCHIKVDFCANKPCPEGQRCLDHGNDFSCECPEGLNGVDCSNMPRMQCNVNPCTHGGTCWSSGDSFYCACRPGFTGTMCEDEFVVETVVSSNEFMVDDTSARNFNDKTFASSVVLKSPIELHNAYFAAGVLAAALFIVAIVVTICHCKVNQTYRKFSTRSTTFFPIIGFGRRNKTQHKLNKHWLSGKGFGGNSNQTNASGTTLRANSTATGTTATTQQQHHHVGGQLHERPFQRHLAMNLENDMYYTVDFSENSQHSPLIQ